MKKLLLFFTLAFVAMSCGDPYDHYQSNKIWYTTADGNIVVPKCDEYGYKHSRYGASIVSNKYDAEKECWVITFDGDVTTIGYSAFEDCSNLTSITIPNSVTTIGDSAFSGCSSLTSITIPDNVTTIEYRAFKGCSSLTSVTIPDSVTKIEGQTFMHCSSLKEINSKYASEDHRCLIIDGMLDSFARAGLTEYIIPDSVTTIGNSTFSGCSSLRSITIPDSVTTIENLAFEDCSSLTSITIPDSVTKIGALAFDDCSSLRSVYCKAITPPLGGWCILNLRASQLKILKIYVPIESVKAYKSAKEWSNYANSIVGYDF